VRRDEAGHSGARLKRPRLAARPTGPASVIVSASEELEDRIARPAARELIEHRAGLRHRGFDRGPWAQGPSTAAPPRDVMNTRNDVGPDRPEQVPVGVDIIMIHPPAGAPGICGWRGGGSASTRSRIAQDGLGIVTRRTESRHAPDTGTRPNGCGQVFLAKRKPPEAAVEKLYSARLLFQRGQQARPKGLATGIGEWR